MSGKIHYKSYSHSWKYPTRPQLLDVEVGLLSFSQSAAERKAFAKHKLNYLKGILNADLKALTDAYTINPNFNLNQAKDTLFVELGKISHNILGAENDRLINRCDAETEEAAKIERLKEEWSMLLAAHFSDLILKKTPLPECLRIMTERINYLYQDGYLQERETIKQHYRVGHKKDFTHNDFDLQRHFNEMIVPKCEKKLKQCLLKLELSLKIKNELHKDRSTAECVKKLMGIKDWYSVSLSRIKTNPNLKIPIRSRAGAVHPRKGAVDLDETAEEIESFFDKRAEEHSERMNETRTILTDYRRGTSKTPPQVRESPRHKTSSFNSSVGSNPLRQKLKELKEDYKELLAEAFLDIDGNEEKVLKVYSNLKSLENNYIEMKQDILRNYNPEILRQQGGISQSSLIHVILSPFIPGNKTIDQVIRERLQELRQTSSKAGPSTALDQTFSIPIRTSPFQPSPVSARAYKKPKVTKFIRESMDSPRNLTATDVLLMVNESTTKIPPVNLIQLLPAVTGITEHCVTPLEIPTSAMNSVNVAEMERAAIESGGWFNSKEVRTDFLSLKDLNICDIVEPELNNINTKIDQGHPHCNEFVKIAGPATADRVHLRGTSTPKWFGGHLMAFPNEDPHPRYTNPDDMLSKTWNVMGAPTV